MCATGMGWHEVNINVSSLEPGLYVVSVNVVAEYAFSTIPGGATPSLLTLVAGSFADQNSPNPLFPQQVFHGSGHPNGYFWLDVDFTPQY